MPETQGNLRTLRCPGFVPDRRLVLTCRAARRSGFRPGARAIGDTMTTADRAQDGFEVPDPVAAELRARGYLRAGSSSEDPAGTMTFLALTVRHRGGSSVVFLVQLPGVARALAQALVTWFNGSALDEVLELVAQRAGESGAFRSDSAPSVDGVASFLREGIWGDDAPPDDVPGDLTECARIRFLGSIRRSAQLGPVAGVGPVTCDPSSSR
jgi:hypothetical protein